MEHIRKSENQHDVKNVQCLASEESRSSFHLGVISETEVKKFIRYAPHVL